ncbi:MAG TPA: STAS domain-containing protein [Solirubrobacteraceae bacterium]
MNVVNHGDEVVLVVVGEIDAAATGGLEAGLLQAEASDASVILVDLDQVDFMDAAALRVLARHAAEERDRGRLRFTQGSAAVRRLISLAEGFPSRALGC